MSIHVEDLVDVGDLPLKFSWNILSMFTFRGRSALIWRWSTYSGQARAGARRRLWCTGWQTCRQTEEPPRSKSDPEPRTWTVKKPPTLTGVHVCSVGQRLCLPPKVNRLLLLLLQDEPTHVGLDLDSQTQEPSVSPGFYWAFVSLRLLKHKPSPALAPAASWPRPSGLQTHLPPAAPSSSSTQSLREFNLKVRSSCDRHLAPDQLTCGLERAQQNQNFQA